TSKATPHPGPLPAEGRGSPTQPSAGYRPDSSLTTEHTTRQKVAEQLEGCMDAGDFYCTLTSKHSLFRLPGSVAIRLKPTTRTEQIVRALTAPGGALEHYQLDLTLRKDLLVLTSSPSERRLQQCEPS